MRLPALSYVNVRATAANTVLPSTVSGGVTGTQGFIVLDFHMLRKREPPPAEQPLPNLIYPIVAGSLKKPSGIKRTPKCRLRKSLRIATLPTRLAEVAGAEAIGSQALAPAGVTR